MDSRKVVLLVGALIVAALTAFFARTLVMGSGAPMAGAAPAVVIDGPEVLVATRALPVGTIIDATALQYKPWPKELVDNAYYLRANSNLQALQGTVVRNPITAGQPLTQGALVKPGDRGFLAAALGPGMRAVTVPVAAQAGVSGFVFPGDRIDLVLTQSVAGGGDGPPLKVSETIVRNMRVLAVDQRTDTSVDETTGKTIAKLFSSITVEATPKISEQIAVAQTLGSLSLSLRSIADNSTELEQAIASGTVKVPEGVDPKAEKAMLVQLATQPASGNPTFATGADVSRFQRRSVPGKGQAAGGMAPTVSVAPTPAPFPGGATISVGPVVRIARGTSITAVPVGGKN
ncbi:Flp pilus assembly protein CpaB [Sphingomonas sp.]|jgi:pilus assembly protein CpaB|uniref:Flp pilus assembly protein CpaB n=1 Tax=Sphingomonas sp. TaxID=28214 RepID=UPI002D7ECC86|nr:Flp pilus assembly protein CpaB [Sphingomonas sp.]HEU0044058.1 Flp pilus assembly protein CpaB [Sphingomonas sp.]